MGGDRRTAIPIRRRFSVHLVTRELAGRTVVIPARKGPGPPVRHHRVHDPPGVIRTHHVRVRPRQIHQAPSAAVIV